MHDVRNYLECIKGFPVDIGKVHNMKGYFIMLSGCAKKLKKCSNTYNDTEDFTKLIFSWCFFLNMRKKHVWKSNAIDMDIWNRKPSKPEQMENIVETENIVMEQIKKVKNWSVPGKDEFHWFWLKPMSILHPHLENHFNQMLREGLIED